MIIDRATEEAIRKIVREEIAEDEMRRQEAAPKLATDAAVPGGLNPPPGTIYLTEGDHDVAALRYALASSGFSGFETLIGPRGS